MHQSKNDQVAFSTIYIDTRLLLPYILLPMHAWSCVVCWAHLLCWQIFSLLDNVRFTVP